jgi:hypothetical protein
MKNYNSYKLDLLTEISFEIIKTSYDISTKYLNNKEVLVYSFTSKKDNEYSVYFLMTEEEDFDINDKKLSDYCNLDEIPTIFFSLTKREFGESFDSLVNKQEYLEVMGKVVYLIKKYMSNHNYNVYTIGEVSDKKQDFYNNYNKYFKDFLMIKNKSQYYSTNKCIYLIKDLNKYNVDKIKIDENLFLKIKK